jgi:G6PDH family F420-dependent oxidoreductase
MRIGYFLSSEEFGPHELVDQARLAQSAGLDRLWISDHYHPWNDEQGQSPFVWSVIGALAVAVPGMHVTTAVTCPTVRIHPAVIAQAAATSTVLLDGRFALGVGSGEAFCEHVLGDGWPEAEVCQEMLEEAIEVMRGLWEGGQVSHYGPHYAVETRASTRCGSSPTRASTRSTSSRSASVRRSSSTCSRATCCRVSLRPTWPAGRRPRRAPR